MAAKTTKVTAYEETRRELIRKRIEFDEEEQRGWHKIVLRHLTMAPLIFRPDGSRFDGPQNTGEDRPASSCPARCHPKKTAGDSEGIGSTFLNLCGPGWR